VRRFGGLREMGEHDAAMLSVYVPHGFGLLSVVPMANGAQVPGLAAIWF